MLKECQICNKEIKIEEICIQQKIGSFKKGMDACIGFEGQSSSVAYVHLKCMIKTDNVSIGIKK